MYAGPHAAPLTVLGEPLREQDPDATLPKIDPSRVTAGRLRCPEHNPAVLPAAHSAGQRLPVDLHELLPYNKESAIDDHI